MLLFCRDIESIMSRWIRRPRAAFILISARTNILVPSLNLHSICFVGSPTLYHSFIHHFVSKCPTSTPSPSICYLVDFIGIYPADVVHYLYTQQYPSTHFFVPFALHLLSNCTYIHSLTSKTPINVFSTLSSPDYYFPMITRCKIIVVLIYFFPYVIPCLLARFCS